MKSITEIQTFKIGSCEHRKMEFHDFFLKFDKNPKRGEL